MKKESEEDRMLDFVSPPPAIICESRIMKDILESVKKVAVTDTTVLITGETGTGKELIAKTIHNMSLRKNGPLVIINCTTIHVNLIESELFGHEKGSFTGAEKKIGKFELANHGTVFLDEIGELPINLQPKLLRVIQERTFERIGGLETIQTDVRIIAATNRDLKQQVKKCQ